MYLNEHFFLSWFHWSRTSAQHSKVRCSCQLKIMVVKMKCNLAHSEHCNLLTQQPDYRVRLYC